MKTPSFPRRRESPAKKNNEIAAYAGMTYYEEKKRLPFGLPFLFIK
jgi:hypothetical protein